MAELLLVDDEPLMRNLLQRVLVADGHTVTVAPTGRRGIDAFSARPPDLVLLDLILPDMSGEFVLNQLMSISPDVRVVVLSSAPEIGRRVSVLTNGAVDFLAKPFANDELRARIQVRLRQTPGDAQTARYLLSAGLRVDLERREVLVDGRSVELSHREFVLLVYLLRRPGAVCSRQELLDNVWGLGFDPGTNVVDVYMSRLRGRLTTERIETVRNRGYRLVDR